MHIRQMHNKSLSDENTLFEKKNIYELLKKIIFSWKIRSKILFFAPELKK